MPAVHGAAASRAALCMRARVQRSLLPTLLLLALVPASALAQRGATLTPDRLTYLVNKDLAGERWTITVNLATFDPTRIINVTGNVYRPGAASPAFIWCRVRPDSLGTLDDPASEFRLRCASAARCEQSALACARGTWQPVADDVRLPASFFLPPLGNGTTARSAAVPVGAPPTAPLVRAPADTLPSPERALAESRGTNLSPDVTNFLVNDDVGTDRWSISLNLVPAQAEQLASVGGLGAAGLENRRLNVTGNVFPSGSGAPIFIFCQERPDSLGDLANQQSLFRLSCLAAGPCAKTATECALQDWQLVPGAGDVQVPSSFFLPVLGLPGTRQSDPELLVIGRTSDGTSIVGPALEAGATLARIAGGCAEGAACSLPIGSCPAVPGNLALVDGRCSCFVARVPDECILCGGGASGQCGADCSYPVGGGATARGTCLPYSSESGACACVATAFDTRLEAGQCNGPLGALCGQGECCADDPRDGCEPARGDSGCSGVCVDSAGCDPTRETCGTCFDQRGASGGACSGTTIEPGEACCDDARCRETGECVCEVGTACVDGERRCCPTNRPQLCERPDLRDEPRCIPVGAECCEVGGARFCTPPNRCPRSPQSEGCIRPGDVECDNGVACGGGFVCFSGGCMQRGNVDCGDGTSCLPGQACGAGGCVQARPDDCGNGLVCRYADGLYCAPDGRTCVPLGSEYCGNGLACGVDEYCSDDGTSCLPLVKCDGGYVCPPDYLCSFNRPGSCIAPGYFECLDGGSSCPAGTYCGIEGCIEFGRLDCGDGTSCPFDTLCTDDGCEVLDGFGESVAASPALPAAAGTVAGARVRTVR